MRTRIPIRCLVLAAAVAAAPAVRAQTAGSTSGARTGRPDTSSTASRTSGLSAVDKSFVKKAALDGMAEVEKGKLAADHATSDDVKTFGKHMSDDHGKANDELKSIASSKGIELPAAIGKGDQKKIDKMSSLSGERFDTAFRKDMVKDHKSAVALFEKEARHGKDPDLKAFAEKTLPTLREHLRMAQDLAGKGSRPAELPHAGKTDSGAMPR